MSENQSREEFRRELREQAKKSAKESKVAGRTAVICFISGFATYWGVNNLYSIIVWVGFPIFAISGIYLLWLIISDLWRG